MMMIMKNMMMMFNEHNRDVVTCGSASIHANERVSTVDSQVQRREHRQSAASAADDEKSVNMRAGIEALGRPQMPSDDREHEHEHSHSHGNGNGNGHGPVSSRQHHRQHPSAEVSVHAQPELSIHSVQQQQLQQQHRHGVSHYQQASPSAHHHHQLVDEPVSMSTHSHLQPHHAEAHAGRGHGHGHGHRAGTESPSVHSVSVSYAIDDPPSVSTAVPFNPVDEPATTRVVHPHHGH